MITSKFRIFALFTFLLFCTVMPLANAFPTLSRFYVKIYANPSDATINHHYVMGKYEILDFSQWGNLTAEGGNIKTPPIGRFDWHIVQITDRTTLRSAIFGQFTMRFDSGQYAGKTIVGTCVANITLLPSGGGQVVSGTFVGRGGLNVAGHIGPIEVPSGAAFDGYSW